MKAMFGSDRRWSSAWNGFIGELDRGASAVARVTVRPPATVTVRPSAAARTSSIVRGDAVHGARRDGLGGRVATSPP